MLVLGDIARKNGLATSLLQRLRDRYQTLGPVFRKMICKLDHCHRCHKEILNISNHFFYEAALKIPKNEPTPPPHPDYPYPLAFVCTSVQTNVTKVMSMKNKEEAEVVLNLARDIGLTWPKRIWGKSHLSQMCIISPSRKQVRLSN